MWLVFEVLWCGGKAEPGPTNTAPLFPIPAQETPESGRDTDADIPATRAGLAEALGMA